MDIKELHLKIEILRSELTAEYEKCVDKGGINQKVIVLSQKLDKLILDYVKISTPYFNKHSTYNEKSEIA